VIGDLTAKPSGASAHSRKRKDDMTQTFSKLRLSLSAVIAAAAVLLMAAPSLAGTMYFGEVLTASEFWPAGNVRATLDAGIVSKDPLNILFDGEITKNAGLGSGYLSGTGDSVTYTHRFTPALAWENVTSATLTIATKDDQLFSRRDGPESVEIQLNDSFWASGGAAGFQIFGGNVTALFSNNDDQLKVSVISRGGDSNVLFSAMSWKYETAGGPSAGTGAQPVPEPTALALFGIGTLIVRQASRRRA
jgi:hypothetical protein